MPGHFSLYDVSGRLIRRYIIEIDKALHFAPVHCLKFRLAVLMYRIGDIRRYDADRIIAGEQNNINVTIGYQFSGCVFHNAGSNDAGRVIRRVSLPKVTSFVGRKVISSNAC